MSANHPIGDPAELAALYAAGAMTTDEAAAFEAHLATPCDLCTAELTALDPVVRDLLSTVRSEPVGPRVRDNLLARIRTHEAEPPASTRPGRERDERLSDEPDVDPQIWKHWSSDVDTPVIIRNASASEWEDIGIEGIRIRRLSVDRRRNQTTMLVRMAPGTSYPAHVHDGPEECMVLEGDLHTGHNRLTAGDYQRMTPGTRHPVQFTEDGCLLLIVSSLTDRLE